jgi:uncharacterized membrane protein
MDQGFGWHELWSYWWLFMIFWWFGGMRILGAISHRLRHARREDAALATLRDRFARGEIDRAEYEERRAVLRGRSQATTATATAATPGGDSSAWPDLP